MLYELDQQSTTATLASATTDEGLMLLIKQADENALKTFYRRHKALLSTVILQMVRHEEDVDDVLQDVLLEVWKRSESFDVAKGKPLGWVITLARRRGIDRLRRRMSHQRRVERSRDEAERSALITHPGADRTVQAADRAGMLRRILETLPAPQREAVELAFLQGLSQREIAAKTGIPLGTIKTRIELGIHKLRNLADQYGGAEDWGFRG